MSSVVGGVFIVCCLMGAWDLAYNTYQRLKRRRTA